MMKKLFLSLLTVLLFMGSFLFASDRIVILLGAPGAGKGTQASILKEMYQIPHIATGDLFRENLKNNTAIGQKAKVYIEKGALVPDEIVFEMLFDRLAREDCQKGFILDGFPRTLEQAEMLDKSLQGKQFVVLDIEVPDSVIIERLSGRLTCEQCSTPFHQFALPPKKEGICDKCGGKLVQRKDDAAVVVKKRLTVYHTQTEPLKKYYHDAGKLIEIEGTQSKEAITSQILALFGTKKS